VKKPKPMDSEMTRAERLDLAKLVRVRVRVTMHDIDQRVAQELARIESQLAAKYSANHKKWAAITKHAQQVVDQADQQVAALCRQMGIPESFRPRLNLVGAGGAKMPTKTDARNCVALPKRSLRPGHGERRSRSSDAKPNC
jgi:hypothetical protein